VKGLWHFVHFKALASEMAFGNDDATSNGVSAVWRGMGCVLKYKINYQM
jgi:hypothetical protein